MVRQRVLQPASRRERAAATRQRMVEVAYRLMAAKGYPDTKISDVAAEAGVAVQTVYFTFHNKPGLMRAAWEFAVKGDHQAAGLEGQAWYAEFIAEPNHELGLALFVDRCTTILRRVLPLAAHVSVLAEDPELADFYAFGERLRRDGYRQAAEVLAEKRRLRNGLSIDDATTILMVLVGIEVYRSMLSEHGWTEAKWRAWVIESVRDQLFGRVRG